MVKKKKETKEKIEVQLVPLNLKEIKIGIKGKTPILVDKFPERVQKEIEDKQTGKAKGAKKKIRNLDQEYMEALHKTSKGQIGFPVVGFKKGMMEVTSYVGDRFFSKKLISGAVQITNAVEGLIPIKCKVGKVRHNIGHNIKYSPTLNDWSCELIIQYDANNIAPLDIVTVLQHAGHYVGVGSWRPKCRDGGSGPYGVYEVKAGN